MVFLTQFIKENLLSWNDTDLFRMLVGQHTVRIRISFAAPSLVPDIS
jgi:hypothetical protein